MKFLLRYFWSILRPQVVKIVMIFWLYDKNVNINDFWEDKHENFFWWNL